MLITTEETGRSVGIRCFQTPRNRKPLQHDWHDENHCKGAKGPLPPAAPHGQIGGKGKNDQIEPLQCSVYGSEPSLIQQRTGEDHQHDAVERD